MHPTTKKKLLLLSSTATAKVCVLQKKGIFSKVPSELLKDFEKKTSQPPPTELILLKSKRKRKSSPSLYVSWFIICPPKKIYCTTTAFITLLHPWFYLKKRKWTRKEKKILFLFEYNGGYVTASLASELECGSGQDDAYLEMAWKESTQLSLCPIAGGDEEKPFRLEHGSYIASVAWPHFSGLTR